LTAVRERFEEAEYKTLVPQAAHAKESRGRLSFQEKCPVRTDFQRDRDRIIHSNSFRRLKQKTQVFLDPEGDHYRTRLTHTLEVSQIARTVARALSLNEDLTESIALGHDLGHTPFGHAGERILNQLYEGGFRHNEQSLRVVDKLEKDGAGLNLTYEVRDGILNHVGISYATTLEGRIVRHADRIAYVNHDYDDAIRAGILKEDEIPTEVREVLGKSKTERINTAVLDLIENNTDLKDITFSQEVGRVMEDFHTFMFEQVYRNPIAKGQEGKAQDMLAILYQHYMKHEKELPPEYKSIIETEGLGRAVCDYVACMTDRYALERFKDIYIPLNWQVL